MDEVQLLEWTLAIHALATWYMVGLIWFVQLVHYPGFSSIPEEKLQGYANRHVQRTGWVVGPAMIVEALTAGVLLWWMPGWWSALGAALVASIWAATALVQVPAHRHLCEQGYDEAVIDGLVRSNWLRTIAWSARGIVALALMMMWVF